MEQQLNQFLVRNFNNILRLEERVLSGAMEGKLTVNEYHVLEAVAETTTTGDNTMSEVAARLGVTVGSLTTAVKTLSAKGFLLRQKGDLDKRTVWLLPTPAGDEANAIHREFHRQMVSGIIDCLDHRQLEALTAALSVLGDWFTAIRAEQDYITISGTPLKKENEI